MKKNDCLNYWGTKVRIESDAISIFRFLIEIIYKHYYTINNIKKNTNWNNKQDIKVIDK